MDETARAAFRAFQETGYSGESALASLAVDRGFVPHPCDWFSTGETRLRGFAHVDDLYQPWIDELADLGIRYAGLPLYHIGVTVTKANWHRHGAPAKSFKNMLRRDRPAALELLEALDTLKWESSMCAVIACLGAHPMDTPFLKRFVSEGSPKIQAQATDVLEKMAGETTEEQVAAALTQQFDFHDNSLSRSDLFDFDITMRLLKKTRLELFARELDITPLALAESIPSNRAQLATFAQFIGETGDTQTRSRFAQKLLENDTAVAASLYRDVSPELWELAAKQSFSAEHRSSVFPFHGYGNLSIEQISDNFDLGFFKFLKSEPPRRILVMNDALLFYGLAADKDAARHIISEAIRAGLDGADPRLTVLKYNLTL